MVNAAVYNFRFARTECLVNVSTLQISLRRKSMISIQSVVYILFITVPLKMADTNAANEIKALIAKKDQIEAEIKRLMSILDEVGNSKVTY